MRMAPELRAGGEVQAGGAGCTVSTWLPFHIEGGIPATYCTNGFDRSSVSAEDPYNPVVPRRARS